MENVVDQRNLDVLDKIMEGDADALGEVLSDIASDVVSLFQGCSSVVNEAEGIASEALMRALHKRHEFRGECTTMTWLKSIGRNVARERYRIHRREVALDDDYCEVANIGPDPEEEVMREEERRLKTEYAKDARAALNEREREIVSMVYEQGLPVKETARRLGTTEDAVSSLLRRARGKMRAVLENVAF
jgi:RNA polymerase sigma-70 factor (ECF subfamily)